MLSGIKRVIFDIDGTLIDHQDTEKEITDLANVLGVKYTQRFHDEIINFFKNHESRIRDKIITREFYKNLIEEMIPILKEYRIKTKDFMEAIIIRESVFNPGSKEILEYLYKKKYNIVALTNWFAMDQIMIMKTYGMLKYFDRIYGWDDSKPKPDINAYIRCLADTKAEENIYIGDSVTNDIEQPKKLGIKTVGYRIDKNKYYEEKYIPDFYIKNLIEIKNIL